MASEIIKNGIIGTLESLVEMIANVTETKGTLHQLDLDLLQEQIRKLYREVQLLDEANRKEISASMQIRPETVIKTVVEQSISARETPVDKIQPEVKEVISPASEVIPEPTPEPVIQPEIAAAEPEPEPEVCSEIKTEEVVAEIHPEPVIVPEPVVPEPEPLVVPESANPLAGQVIVAAEKPLAQPANGDLFSQPVTIAEKLKKEDNTIHQQMMANNLVRNEKLTGTPISNLRTSIGINDKFMFVNELFKGEMREYDSVLGMINEASSGDEAMIILQQHLLRHGTAEKAEARGKLEKYIQRRFMK